MSTPAPEAPKPTPPATGPTPTPPADPAPPEQKPQGDKPEQLPADHPLVTALATQKAEITALREKAARLDEIEEANKTAEEKAAERLATAEQRAAEADAKVLRRDLALEYKLTKDDLELLDKITDEATLRDLAARLTPSDPPPPNPSSAALNRADDNPPKADLDAEIAEAEKARNFPLAIALKQQRAAALNKS